MSQSNTRLSMYAHQYGARWCAVTGLLASAMPRESEHHHTMPTLTRRHMYTPPPSSHYAQGVLLPSPDPPATLCV